jgi:hypothetical protein
MQGARQHECLIDEELIAVWVGQEGPSRWRAYATFRGSFIEAKGRDESAALSDWRKKADYKARE